MSFWCSGYEAPASEASEASASASEASASSPLRIRMRVLEEACGVWLYCSPHARLLL